MTMSQICKVVVLFAALFVLASPQGLSAEGLRGGFDEAFGPRIHPGAQQAQPNAKHRPRHVLDRAVAVREWNQIAIDASGLDHTPNGLGEDHVFGQQLGPGRSSRAMAIVHLAIFDVVNAVEGGYKSYTGLAPAKVGTSLPAAVAQAAHDTLAALFPSQAARFKDFLAKDLSEIQDGQLKTNGIALGQRAAAAVLPRVPTIAHSTMNWTSASATSASFSRATLRVNGGRIPSAILGSRWAPNGAR